MILAVTQAPTIITIQTKSAQDDFEDVLPRNVWVTVSQGDVFLRTPVQWQYSVSDSVSETKSALIYGYTLVYRLFGIMW